MMTASAMDDMHFTVPGNGFDDEDNEKEREVMRRRRSFEELLAMAQCFTEGGEFDNLEMSGGEQSFSDLLGSKKNLFEDDDDREITFTPKKSIDRGASFHSSFHSKMEPISPLPAGVLSALTQESPSGVSVSEFSDDESSSDSGESDPRLNVPFSPRSPSNHSRSPRRSQRRASCFPGVGPAFDDDFDGLEVASVMSWQSNDLKRNVLSEHAKKSSQNRMEKLRREMTGTEEKTQASASVVEFFQSPQKSTSILEQQLAGLGKKEPDELKPASPESRPQPKVGHSTGSSAPMRQQRRMSTGYMGSTMNREQSQRSGLSQLSGASGSIAASYVMVAQGSSPRRTIPARPPQHPTSSPQGGATTSRNANIRRRRASMTGGVAMASAMTPITASPSPSPRRGNVLRIKVRAKGPTASPPKKAEELDTEMVRRLVKQHLAKESNGRPSSSAHSTSPRNASELSKDDNEDDEFGFDPTDYNSESSSDDDSMASASSRWDDCSVVEATMDESVCHIVRRHEELYGTKNMSNDDEDGALPDIVVPTTGSDDPAGEKSSKTKSKSSRKKETEEERKARKAAKKAKREAKKAKKEAKRKKKRKKSKSKGDDRSEAATLETKSVTVEESVEPDNATDPGALLTNHDSYETMLALQESSSTFASYQTTTEKKQAATNKNAMASAGLVRSPVLPAGSQHTFASYAKNGVDPSGYESQGTFASFNGLDASEHTELSARNDLGGKDDEGDDDDDDLHDDIDQFLASSFSDLDEDADERQAAILGAGNDSKRALHDSQATFASFQTTQEKKKKKKKSKSKKKKSKHDESSTVGPSIDGSDKSGEKKKKKSKKKSHRHHHHHHHTEEGDEGEHSDASESGKKRSKKKKDKKKSKKKKDKKRKKDADQEVDVAQGKDGKDDQDAASADTSKEEHSKDSNEAEPEGQHLDLSSTMGDGEDDDDSSEETSRAEESRMSTLDAV